MAKASPPRIKVRVSRDLALSEPDIRGGTVLELPGPQALTRIEAGTVEPEIELVPFAPRLPAGGCSLGEAFRLHVDECPEVKRLVKATNGPVCQPRLRVAKYSSPAKWKMPEGDWPAPLPETFWIPCCRSILACYVHEAIRLFLDRWGRGDLILEGVSKDNSAPARRHPIPAVWRQRNIALQLVTGELAVRTDGLPKRWVPQFSDIRVIEAGECAPAERASDGRAEVASSPDRPAREATTVPTGPGTGPGGDSKWTEAFTTDEWRKGITLHSWALKRAPEVIDAAKRAIFDLCIGFAKECFTERAALTAEARIRQEVKRELDSLLRDGLEAGLYVLGMPAASPTKSAQAVSADALDEVIEGIDWWPDLPSAHYNGEPIALRLYRPGRFTSIGAETGAEGRGDGDAAVERPAKGHAARAKVIGKCKQWLGSQAENGPGVKSKKEYQAEALQKFKGLSRRGFDTAWRMAVGDIPAWTKPGRKPRKNKP